MIAALERPARASAGMPPDRPGPARPRLVGQRSSAADRQRAAAGEGSAAPRVLLVDDEPSMRLLCTVNLRLVGFEVVEAEDGRRALEVARRERFDLILLDVMLPDIGGHDVARRLAAEDGTRDVPVVFLSARASSADKRLGFELGAVDYITKPFDPIVLGEQVEEILGRVARGEADEYRREQLAQLEG